MGEQDVHDFKLKTIGIRANGGREFDPADKERLIIACLKPGVSVAGIAVANGLNPNLVRKWIADHRKKQRATPRENAPTPSAFIQIVAIPEAGFIDTPSQRPDAAIGVQSHRAEETEVASVIVAEDVTPLLEASLEALTTAVVKAIVERHPELDPRVVRRTIERRKHVTGWDIDGGQDSAVQQAPELRRQHVELPESQALAGLGPSRLEASLLPGEKHYLDTDEAAQFLRLSIRTMEKHRCRGTGPIYRKLGGRVVYTYVDLEQWANRGIVSSTSDRTEIRTTRPQHQS
jgi:transposase-like protein